MQKIFFFKEVLSLIFVEKMSLNKIRQMNQENIPTQGMCKVTFLRHIFPMSSKYFEGIYVS